MTPSGVFSSLQRASASVLLGELFFCPLVSCIGLYLLRTAGFKVLDLRLPHSSFWNGSGSVSKHMQEYVSFGLLLLEGVLLKSSLDLGSTCVWSLFPLSHSVGLATGLQMACGSLLFRCCAMSCRCGVSYLC